MVAKRSAKNRVGARQGRGHLKMEQSDVVANDSLHLLREAASHCYQSSESGDIKQTETTTKEFLNVLADVAKSVENSQGNEQISETACRVLQEARALVTSSDPQGQVLLDVLTLDLPSVIVKFVEISENCRGICESIITHMCEYCSPREMMFALSEALSSSCNNETLSSFLPLLHGFTIVILRIQRRPVENINAALPIILRAGKVAVSEAADEDNKDVVARIFEKLIAISTSMREVCNKQVVDEKKNQLRSILGLYTLELLALVSKDGSIAASLNRSEAPPLVLQLSELLPYCGLSYVGLITGRDVEVNHFWNDDGEIVESKSLVYKGAILAVLWGYACKEVAAVACERIDTLLKGLQSCKSERIRALSNMKHVPSLDYPLQIRNVWIEFLSAVVAADSASSKDDDVKIDWSFITPSLFALFQAMQSIVIHMPDPEQREKAFSVLEKTLSELPPQQRFDMLKGLIINSNHPSVASLLIAVVKDEVNRTFNDVSKVEGQDSNNRDLHLQTPFITGDVLELVELILKPPKGGPPDLPGQSDAVIVALNLYRFLLMKEKKEKTNYTGVLSNSCLRKVQSEWLLPLRVLVSGILAENVNDDSEFGSLTVSLLMPVMAVLTHCLELVEEGLKHSI